MVFAPVLTTPLLKIPLLLSHAALTYYGMTPPRQPPPSKELDRFAVPDLMTRTTQLQMAATAAAKYVLCGAAAAEAAVLLAQHAPASPLATHVLALLVPPARAPLALRATPLALAGCALGIAGGLVRVLCHRTLGRFFTWQMAVRDDHELVTRGPYAVVRHPSYSGWVLMVVGAFVLLGSPGSYFVEAGWWADSLLGRCAAGASFVYVAFVTIGLVRRTAKEDRVLQKEFGEDWERWAKKTPYRLVPFVY